MPPTDSRLKQAMGRLIRDQQHDVFYRQMTLQVDLLLLLALRKNSRSPKRK